MTVTIVLACSIGIQLAAAVMAFRLIILTGKRVAWSLITIALLLMLIRRIIPFYYLLSGNLSFHPDILNEIIGLTLSLFILIGIIIITPYLSDVRLSEESVQDAEEKYRSLFNNAYDAIYLIEHQTHKILDCNTKAAEMIGYNLEELHEMTFFDLFLNNEKNILQTKFK
ncbi:MAG: PAS domain S-box protein, partial [Bacteroidales bacterium]